MSDCKLIPGLDYCFCQTCCVWIPSDYQITILLTAKENALQALKDWERGRQKGAKPPKSIMEKIKKTREEFNQAMAVFEDHTKFAVDKPAPDVPKRKPTTSITLTGYSWDDDNDFELGVTA